jgi:hypothetical protein
MEAIVTTSFVEYSELKRIKVEHKILIDILKQSFVPNQSTSEYNNAISIFLKNNDSLRNKLIELDIIKIY